MSNVFGEFDVAPTESKTTCTAGNFPHGSRETPAASAAPLAADRSEKCDATIPTRAGATGLASASVATS